MTLIWYVVLLLYIFIFCSSYVVPLPGHDEKGRKLVLHREGMYQTHGQRQRLFNLFWVWCWVLLRTTNINTTQNKWNKMINVKMSCYHLSWVLNRKRWYNLKNVMALLLACEKTCLSTYLFIVIVIDILFHLLLSPPPLPAPFSHRHSYPTPTPINTFCV